MTAGVVGGLSVLRVELTEVFETGEGGRDGRVLCCCNSLAVFFDADEPPRRVRCVV